MRAELGAVPLVEMRSIAKKFGETQILRDVSFDLRAGEVHALLGENGAGKSTLMKILVGVHRPDGGEVLLSGTDVTDRTIGEKLAGGIAMIFQELSLVPNLTVAENLFLGREPLLPGWIVDNRALRRKARALLDEYDFPVSAEARVETLGFAQRQMVEIVKALASGARVLVMDEPTSSLTVEEEEKLFALIAQLKRRGIGIVYISHRMTEIFKVSDRISVMKDGRMLPPEDVGSTNRDRIALLMSRPGDRTETSAEGRGAVRPGTAPALALTGLRTQRKFREPLDLTVAAGEIVGLAGLVGSGRSTLAKAIFGLLPDAEGNLAVAGHPVRLGSPRHAVEAGIGLVPEDRRLEGLVVEHSLSRNVALASLERLARVYPIPHLSPRAGDAPYERFRRKLGILARAPQQEARELSGGNQQKVVVAKWLATSPRLLLLDEPTSGVDVNAKEDMRSFVREAARDGLGVLLIASELEELTRLADRIVTIADGRLGRELGSGIGEAELRGALQADIDARKRRNLQ